LSLANHCVKPHTPYLLSLTRRHYMTDMKSEIKIPGYIQQKNYRLEKS